MWFLDGWSKNSAIQNILQFAVVILLSFFRNEILSRFVERLLDSYRRLFPTCGMTPVAALSALDALDRRFAWFKRTLREFHTKYGMRISKRFCMQPGLNVIGITVHPHAGQHFPISWNVPCLVSLGFCRITREQLTEILSASSIDPLVMVRQDERNRKER